MHDRDKYKQVKIERGELIVRIKNTSQSDWIKVCDKLDIIVSTEYGRGSHAVAYKDNCPPERSECCIATIHTNLHPEIQRDMFKKFLSYGLESGKYTEDDIWKALKVL